MLDRMELAPEAVLVTHVGGTYGDTEASRARWAGTWPTLPEHVRRRLVLEHDGIRFSAADTIWIHGHAGVPLVSDYQRHWCLNPAGLVAVDALRAMLRTWPAGVRPEVRARHPQEEGRTAAAGVDGPRGLHQAVRVRALHAGRGRAGGWA